MATSFRDRIAENIQNWREIANPVEKPSDKIRDDFVSEIARFYEDGTEPTRASQDMRYFLHQHEKRLAEKGVKIQRRYEVLEKGVKHTATKNRPPYTVDLSFVECESSTQYSNVSSQKILKKHKKSASIFYTNILNRPDIQNAAYTCPNCGHPATLEIFANGCPMCGTRFQMKQLFPCVTNFYLMSQLMGKTNMDDIIKRVRFLAILFGIYVAIYAGVASWSGVDRAWVSILIGAFAGLAGGGLGFIIIYMIYSIFFAIFAMGKMTAHAVSTADIASAALTKNALSKAMARFDPEFSYELFEGKAMSLFRAIAFSEDRTNMSIYRGDPNIPDIDNLIDIDYRGAMKFLNLTVQNGDDLVLLVRLYMFNTYLIDGKIVQRKEDFNMTLVKKLTAKEDYGFSIHAVNCKTCAASFDAMHLLQCPNCGTPYHLENEEWVVMGLKK
jgi:rubrerythrin